MRSKIFVLLLPVIISACGEQSQKTEHIHYSDIHKIKKYTTITFNQHAHLKQIKIFIDPGHGGHGEKDIFRVGPGGLTEEEVNLRVSLLLAEMLRQSGAIVQMSRTKDIMLGLDERVNMAEQFKPHMFLSVHHNGSLRSIDNINYPSVLFWGSKENNPASYDFSCILNRHMSKTMGIKGHVISDYTTFWESGTRVLRKTRNICPGALGEFGFFSDEQFEQKLKDYAFNIKEAEAYFLSVSEYFKKGLPEAEVYLTTPRVLVNKRYKFLARRSTGIYIKVAGNTKSQGIKPQTMNVTINRQPVAVKKITYNTYKILFGRNLTPGEYRIQFSFKNNNGQSSMLLRTQFSVGLKKNEFNRLTTRSFNQIDNGKYKAGLRKLLPLYYYCTHEPVGDRAAYYIGLAFEKTGDVQNASYFYSRVYHFYPQSKYRAAITSPYITGRRFRIDNYGSPVSLKYMPSEKNIINATIE